MVEKQRTPLALSDTLLGSLQSGENRMTVRALNDRDYTFWQDEDEDGWPIYEDDLGDMYRAPTPYGPAGSLLWVRESYRVAADGSVEYRQEIDPERVTANKEWLPVVGMPEAHSRYRLQITSYRFLSDVQDLTNSDLGYCGFSGEGARARFRKYWNKRYRAPFRKVEQGPAVWLVRFKLVSPTIP